MNVPSRAGISSTRFDARLEYGGIEVVARCMYDGGDLGRFNPGVHLVLLHLHAVPLARSNLEGGLDDTQTEPLLVRVVDHRQDLFKLGALLLHDA